MSLTPRPAHDLTYADTLAIEAVTDAAQTLHDRIRGRCPVSAEAKELAAQAVGIGAKAAALIVKGAP